MRDLNMKVKKKAISKGVKRGCPAIRVRDACLLSKVEMMRGEARWKIKEAFTVRVVLTRPL